MDRREHHRAQLNLPVRLRWTTPFGQRTEVCETQNVSRGGLLVPAAETHASGVSLWVTFPFDNSLGDGQPEIPAKVVRTKETQNGAEHANGNAASRHNTTREKNGVGRTLLALHFAPVARSRRNGDAHRVEKERRLSARRALSLPIRVRPEQMLWFEEAMTINVSANGIRFLSTREYLTGELLLISFESPATAPWTGATEFRSRVVRTESRSQASALEVTVCRIW
jgi:PilZ domain